jgi:NAD(P)-dependent dehydrogenase (short-subunit alcohol dehydrogenase family)
MNIKYKDQIALVTGGERGLGRQIANKLIENGVQVIVTSRTYSFNPKQSIAADQKIIKQYLDVTSEDSINDFFSWIKSLNKKILVLVNNAGVGLFGPFA